MQTASPARGGGTVKRFLRGRSGLSAIEFALVAPMMIAMYLGTFELVQGIQIKRQVTLTASTVANIVTQYASISASTEMPDILNASVSTMLPFPDANAVVTVSLIYIDGSGNATISWSQSLHGTQRVKGSAVTVPASLDTPNTYLVWGETTYTYKPDIDFVKMGTVSVYSSVYMSPRSSSGTIALTT